MLPPQFPCLANKYELSATSWLPGPVCGPSSGPSAHRAASQNQGRTSTTPAPSVTSPRLSALPRKLLRRQRIGVSPAFPSTCCLNHSAALEMISLAWKSPSPRHEPGVAVPSFAPCSLPGPRTSTAAHYTLFSPDSSQSGSWRL